MLLLLLLLKDFHSRCSTYFKVVDSIPQLDAPFFVLQWIINHKHLSLAEGDRGNFYTDLTSLCDDKVGLQRRKLLFE